MTTDTLHWRGKDAVFATMHGKERAIAPLASRWLGLRLVVADGLNTDAFGTFTRDISRPGSSRDAARVKIDAAFAMSPERPIGLASEGSFGPHPQLPYCALDREIVLLVDREHGFEIVGHFATPDTNYGHSVVTDVANGVAFAERAGFPDHGVIVMGCRDGDPAPAIAMFKDIANVEALIAALNDVIVNCGAAWIETDMRAHRNPRRTRAIKYAMLDLLCRARSRCPECGQPGYAVTGRIAGLPCAACGEPTSLARADVVTCSGCHQRAERASPRTVADPGHCGACNP